MWVGVGKGGRDRVQVVGKWGWGMEGSKRRYVCMCLGAGEQLGVPMLEVTARSFTHPPCA